MRFSLLENDIELGALSVSHLCGTQYALARHAPPDAGRRPAPKEWLELYAQALNYARSCGAESNAPGSGVELNAPGSGNDGYAPGSGAVQLLHRLVETGDHAPISAGLPKLGFERRGRRIEFRRLLAELPDEEGTPLSWASAAELGWGAPEIAALLERVAAGDPGHDPAESALAFIQDWLADPVLTAGTGCVGVGALGGETAALVVAQVNPRSGWSRLSYMGVVPEFRGRGLGLWVQRDGFALLRALGGVLYHGGTDAGNAPMLALFARHGCQVWARMEEWVYPARQP